MKEELQSYWDDNSTRGKFTYLLILKVSVKRLWSKYVVKQILINHDTFPFYFERFNFKSVPQSYSLCGMQGLIDDLHFIIFCKRLNTRKNTPTES